MPILRTVTEASTASLFVVFLFLPLSLFAFYSVPVKFRVQALVVVSSIFILLVQPIWLPFLLVSVSLSYLCYFFVVKHGLEENKKKSSLWYGIGVFINIGVFIFTGAFVQLKAASLPLGGLVYPIISIVILSRAYKSTDHEVFNFWEFLLQNIFFPQLYAGPLISKRNLSKGIISSELSLKLFINGFSRFIQGVFKTAVLGGWLWDIFTSIRGFSARSTTLLSSWLYIITFALAFYFILSGFCDIAVGIGTLFGIPLPDNFAHPYQVSSIYTFTKRFHISWGAFLRKFVYEKLVKERSTNYWKATCIIVTGLFYGIWFGFTLNYMLWGGFLALFLVIEKMILSEQLVFVPSLMKRLFTLFIILLSLPILTESTVSSSIMLYQNLFAVSGNRIPLYNDNILYLLTSNWLIYPVSALLCTSLLRAGIKKYEAKFPKSSYVITGIANGILLVLTTALLV